MFCDDWSDMEDEKELVVDEAPEEEPEAEAAGEDLGVAEEPEPAEEVAGPAEDSEAADGAADLADDPKDSDEPSEDSADEIIEDAAGDSAGDAASPVALPEEPEPKRESRGIGDYIVVGIFALILGILLVLPTALGAVGGESSSSATSSSGVAATVNGVAISEDEITKYVMDFRTAQGLSDDDSWGNWMVSYGYDPETLRSDTVEYFINRQLVKQAIAEEGIEVAESEIDDYIASITEQVGGQSAFEEALEMEGLTLDAYREEVLFSLQQQALAKKVASDGAEVDDDQVLELVKMYFPDEVDEDADSLEGVDEDTVEQIRSMLESSVLQQAYNTWMDEYRGKATIVIVDMPEALPYAIDLSPYQESLEDLSNSEDVESADDSEAESSEAGQDK